MLYCEEAHQDNVTQALEKIGLRRMGFAFDSSGAQVLHTGESLWMTAPSFREPFQVTQVT